MISISVIIPTFNRNAALTMCLDKLAPGKQEGMFLSDLAYPDKKRKHYATYEVIVTDDGSSGTAKTLLSKAFPWTSWVSGPKRGPAANRNNGAEKALGEWLVFVDDDCVPEPTLLAAYARASAAGTCEVLEGMTFPQGIRGAADMECPINVSGMRLWSCNFAIKRSLFQSLGGFDANFLGAMEDIDMQTRLFKAGHKIVFVPEARVMHPWRPQKGLQFARVRAIDTVYYVKKHPDYGKHYSLAIFVKFGCRSVLLHFPMNILRYKGKGVLRALILDLVSVSLFIKQILITRLTQ
jgi:GT2 family glycosyltransferase